jgi:hypothetical protein
MRRTLLPLAIVLFCLPQTGCVGSHGRTHKIYSFNKTASPDLMVQELLFLGMNIAPVYPVGGLVDAFVLNIVETFTGDDPATATSQSQLIRIGDGEQVTLIPQGRDLRIEHRIGRKTTVLTLSHSRDGTDLLDAHGQRVRRSRSTVSGAIVVEDGNGETLERHNRDHVLAVTAAWSLRQTDAIADAQ